ncbi:MAG TPA: DUF4328 domain-containing protein [Flavobacteriaceae bacterium]|nr:DUF4328 domain-containing protein [Flavobacteriaceae bacterium]
MEKLRPNGKRAKNAITLIWIVLGVDMILLVARYFEYDLIQTAIIGGYISQEAVDANDLRIRIIGIVYLIVYIISAITFIRWFRRAYYNLHLKLNYLDHKEGWAAGSWFVPIINFYRPYQIMKEMYQETKELLLKKGIAPHGISSNGLVHGWWGLWVLNNVIAQVANRTAKSAETLEVLLATTIAHIVVSILFIPLAIITVKVIKNYASAEPLLKELTEEEEVIKQENLYPEVEV